MNSTQEIKTADIFSHQVMRGPGMEFVRASGVFQMTTRRRNGSIRQAIIVKNLITNAGFAGLSSRCGGAGSQAAFTYIAVGEGNTAAAVTDTTLQTETTTSGLARVNASISQVTTTVTNDTSQAQTTFSVSGTKTICEAGILNAASAGTLLCRVVFTAQPLQNGDSYQVTYKIKFA